MGTYTGGPQVAQRIELAETGTDFEMVGKEVKLVSELHAGHFHRVFVQRSKTDGVDQARRRGVQAYLENLEY
jgi:hypothetical protein